MGVGGCVGFLEAENDLAQRAIGSPGRMTADIRRSWLAKNPEGHYHLKYKNKLVAFSGYSQ